MKNAAINLSRFNKILTNKSGLLLCIFLTLLIQITITASVADYLYNNKSAMKTAHAYMHNIIIFILTFIFCIFLIIAMISGKIPFMARFVLFTIFSLLQGVLIGVAMEYFPKEIIMSALLSTVAIFVAFLLFGFALVYFQFDLSWLGIYLFLGLLALIIARIVNAFASKDSKYHRGLAIVGIVMFSIYILYDTNRIMLKYENKNVDCIRGSLDYYLDMANIFLDYLDLYKH